MSRPDDAAETVRAYDRDAGAYAAATRDVPDAVRARMVDLAHRLGAGAHVLEIGSGGGRDALVLEGLGLRVRRTDVTPGFVALLRDQGHPCDLLDPLVDDLSAPDGPYDALREVVDAAVWGGVEVEEGIAGRGGESWLALSAVRDGVGA